MANVFPTLSILPSYPLAEEREDATISSTFESGYEQTRPRFTRTRRTWTVKYVMASAADKAALDTWTNNTVHGKADTFSWYNPVAAATYTVRFKEPPKYSNALLKYWDIDFALREV